GCTVDGPLVGLHRALESELELDVDGAILESRGLGGFQRGSDENLPVELWDLDIRSGGVPRTGLQHGESLSAVGLPDRPRDQRGRSVLHDDDDVVAVTHAEVARLGVARLDGESV